MEVSRREALMTLASLPAVQSIEVAQLKPGDVIVIEAEGNISMEYAERIEQYAKRIWPDHKCVVLGDGLKMKIARS